MSDWFGAAPVSPNVPGSDNGAAIEISSPASSTHEASNGDMDYAGKGELIACRNELLEAERAGARMTLERLRGACVGPIAELLRAI
ncbi:conserved hypothetical protein [Burkholderiales bacterium]|jgi:hypothetical protein|nr:conserved hypothetical protein [Burkholderiales bacterium]